MMVENLMMKIDEGGKGREIRIGEFICFERAFSFFLHDFVRRLVNTLPADS